MAPSNGLELDQGRLRMIAWPSPTTNASGKPWTFKGRPDSIRERELKTQDAHALARHRAPVGERNPERLRWAAPTPNGTPRHCRCSLNQWNVIFKKTLWAGRTHAVSELRDVRKRWAHQNPFRATTPTRALTRPAGCLRPSCRATGGRTREDEDGASPRPVRRANALEKEEGAGTAIESQAAGVLKPWREVVTPARRRRDRTLPAGGVRRRSWQVHIGRGFDEHTEAGRILPADVLTRVSSASLALFNGCPVSRATRSFSSRRTSVAANAPDAGAVPPLRSGVARAISSASMRGLRARVDKLPTAKRVVLVGNKIRPGTPSRSRTARSFARSGAN